MRHFVLSLLFVPLFCGETAIAQSITFDTNGYCDEAKCRGSRIHPWVDDDTEFTCWVSVDANITRDGILDDTYYTAYEGHYCADGYEGRIVESVAPQEIDGEQRYWFTCCTPGYAGQVKQTCDDWTCSSPDWEGGGNCWADGFQEPMTCGTTERRFPRFTGMKSLIYVQFLCCDSPQVDDTFMQELFIARVLWMSLSGITFLICTIFICGILVSRHARKQGYNLYLVFLALPDAAANLLILIRNGLTIPGVPVNPIVHIFLASFEYFYAASNMWLNAVIVAQIHYVLQRSSRFVKIPPPTPQLVCYQAGGTYALSCLAFGWAFFLYHEGLNVFSLSRVVTVWILTRVVVVAPPLFYVTYVCIDVWYNKLLPRSGRTRVVSLYFLRVIIVFMVTWVPYFIIYEVAWNITHSRWMVYFSYYLGSVQGTLSVLVALSKPDVKRAVLRFMTCQCISTKEDESQFMSSDNINNTSDDNNHNNNTNSSNFDRTMSLGFTSIVRRLSSTFSGPNQGDLTSTMSLRRTSSAGRLESHIDESNKRRHRNGTGSSIWSKDDEWSTDDGFTPEFLEEDEETNNKDIPQQEKQKSTKSINDGKERQDQKEIIQKKEDTATTEANSIDREFSSDSWPQQEEYDDDDDDDDEEDEWSREFSCP